MNIKDTPYWSIFAEVFTVFKESMPVQQSEEYWNQVGLKTMKIAEKYEGTQYSGFVNDQLVSVHEELGRIYNREFPYKGVGS